jgi:hypothetical protein
LKDPSGLFNSSLDGNVRRAIDIHKGDKVDEAALKDLIRAAVALNLKGKSKPPHQAMVKEAMGHKLRTEAGRSIYKMRKAIVEPVFGQIKERRGFRRFSLRGLDKVRREWKLVCLTSNLLKLFGSGWTPQAA